MTLTKNPEGAQPCKILLVDDDEDDFVLVRTWLSSARVLQFDLDWVSTYEDALKKLDSCDYDVLILDYDLGGYSGLDLLRGHHSSDCRLPVVMLTGRGNYETDLEAMQAGVTDYLTKHEVTPPLLERTIRYAIQQKKIEEELKRARDELELRVEERTQELLSKNAALQAEVAERKRMEKELEETRRRIVDQIEAERSKLAQELHDDTMQEIYGLIFQLSGFQTDDLNTVDLLTTCRDKLQRVVNMLRSVSGELRPPALAPYGLEKAIHSHAENLMARHSGLEITLDLSPDDQTLPEYVRLALFRIYQVAITNVLRHAEANQAQVRFSIGPESIGLTVEDDGRGFDLPERWYEFVREGHLGLANAAERAEAVGGKLHVSSKPGEGTRVQVVVPRN